MMEDEDKMIAKLVEHRDIKFMVKEIGLLHDIKVESTVGNDSNGDFMYPKESEKKLIGVLDKYLK